MPTAVRMPTTPSAPVAEAAPNVQTVANRPLIPQALPTQAIPNPQMMPPRTGALDRMDNRMLGSDVKTVFYFWILVFGLVGTQMSWVLRPFIGNPATTHFVLFSQRESNFYAAVWNAIARMIGG